MIIPDRLSLREAATDHWRSLRIYRTGRRDIGAAALLFGLPVAVFFVALFTGFQLKQPTALLPAVALLAGVLLAAAGQILTLRARIADSVVLSRDKRVTNYIRETMSGVVLAAVAALCDALLLGTLASIAPTTNSWTALLSSLVLMVTAHLSLMFVATARRLYSTYLEVFEDGSTLPKFDSREVEQQHRIAISHLDVS